MSWRQLSQLVRGPQSVGLSGDSGSSSPVRPGGSGRTVPAKGGSSLVSSSPPAASRSLRGLSGLRIAFGVAMAIDAMLKWLPGFRHTYVSDVRDAAMGQPGWLHWWFSLWFTLSKLAPNLQVDATAVIETLLAICLLFGVARRLGYVVGAVWMLVVWCVPEGFGGPYTSGATDIGTGIMYSLLFLVLLVVSAPARREPLALDGVLVDRVSWWPRLGEPHRADREACRDSAAVTPTRDVTPAA